MSIANNNVELEDEIRFRWPAEFKKTADERTWIVKAIPTNNPSSGLYWALKGTRHGTLLILTQPISFEVLN